VRRNTASKIALKAGGANLPTPPAVDESRLFAQDPEVVVQLGNTEGMCWSARFVAGRTSHNSPLRFKAGAR